LSSDIKYLLLSFPILFQVTLSITFAHQTNDSTYHCQIILSLSMIGNISFANFHLLHIYFMFITY